MKKKLVLFSAMLTLAAFAAVTGCKRDDDDDYYNYDNVTFWNDQNRIGFVDVTVDGIYTQTIRETQEAYVCNYSGSANFSLQSGYHTYHAIATTGEYWDGSFYLNNSCLLYELYK